ncbi:MAG TPA: carbohydrate ABC transporter permease [Clostridiales bacterium]|nr:carbohydrate ABC transporter permease [Clostridiales bacterium]
MSTVKRSSGEMVFDVANAICLIIFSLLCIYPFLYVFNISVSKGASSAQYGLNLLPKGFTLEYYKQLFRTDAILTGLKNSVLRTISGTFLAVLVTSCGAYPLSKKYLPNRKFWTTIILIPMFFGGGLIPTYLLIKSLRLIDTRWVLILPGLVSTYNLILIRNYMISLPESLEESAKIDGANDIIILFRIILPICKPILATVALWVAVGHWNAWFDSLLYITKKELVVLQVVLYQVLNWGSERTVTGTMDNYNPAQEIIKACTIMVTTIPIILTYPFLQKYFIGSIMVGSVKG